MLQFLTKCSVDIDVFIVLVSVLLRLRGEWTLTEAMVTFRFSHSSLESCCSVPFALEKTFSYAGVLTERVSTSCEPEAQLPRGRCISIIPCS